ncbi:probable purine permease 9 [Sesamum indicum]|uniref:Probable purine permease n=1 Tax=Sesamum indicum TaxID=4182 RepID=A0A6I9UEY5_SESIN|nr:probable purine permease 9 [Sesamum indicum]
MDLPVQETKETNSDHRENGNISFKRIFPLLKQHKMWFQMAIYSLLVLSGQSAATLLGRLYYEKGGKSKYIAALVQSAGFPFLLPFLYIAARNNPTIQQTSPSKNLALPALYICFGTFLAFDCMLYAVGLMYLPVSTFSLICSSQLGFNAFFSYFLNSQKLTPLILNSIVLLTLSTVLLILQPDSSTGAVIEGKYALGFICTLSGAAGYAFLLSAEQLAYGKILKRQTMKEILNVIFYESMVTTCALLVGLFGSEEWRSLKNEMEGFQLGKTLYAMILFSAALAWQVFAIGMVSLMLKISSLFANVVSTMNVPVVPVLAVVVFQDKMSGLKIVAMVLAVWGSLSYVYQQYLDDVKSRAENAVASPIQVIATIPCENEH